MIFKLFRHLDTSFHFFSSIHYILSGLSCVKWEELRTKKGESLLFQAVILFVLHSEKIKTLKNSGFTLFSRLFNSRG